MSDLFEVDLDAIQKLPPLEQEQRVRQLSRFNQAIRDNPLWLYRPHEGEKEWKLKNGIALDGSEARGQMAFHEMNQEGVYQGATVAGNKFGKTHSGLVDCLIQLLPEELVPPWLLPYKTRGFDDEEVYCRAIGVDLPNWLAKTILPKLRKLVPKEAIWKGDFDKAYNDKQHKFRFENGSWLDFLTHDMEVDAFASTDVHRVWFDEEPSGEKGKQQFEESTGRLVTHEGDIRWTLTPLLGLNFVYYELTDREGQPRWDDEVRVVVGDIDHNPHITDKGRDRFLKRWKKDPLKLAARKSGRWVHFAGLIYDEFNDNKHVVNDKEIPRREAAGVVAETPAVEIYASIDPGINEQHQAALLFGWLDESDVLEIFHVWKSANKIVSDVASYFHAFCGEHMFKPRWVTIDPASQNRHHSTGRNLQWEYQQHGVWTIPGQNSRHAGFNAVKERLRDERLLVHASCEELVQEFHEYRWKNPKGRSDDAPKAEPIKRNDDLLDALRYLAMSMPVRPKPGEEEDDLSDGDRAFREELENLGRTRGRIGGAIPV